MAQDLKTTIQQTKESLNQALTQATSIKAIEDAKIHFLGKKGSITQLMAEMKNLSLEDKKEFGPQLNQLRQEADERITQALDQLSAQLIAAENLKKQNFDVTAYLPTARAGHLHPYTPFIEEIQDIFLSMGYEIWNGPELETDFYNFGALNIPKDHPARDMYDTFWTDKPGLLMRTHTSTIQIHALQNNKLPLAGIAPGRAFRHEAVDASHDFMFMQCEGLFVDKNVTVKHGMR